MNPCKNHSRLEVQSENITSTIENSLNVSENIVQSSTSRDSPTIELFDIKPKSLELCYTRMEEEENDLRSNGPSGSGNTKENDLAPSTFDSTNESLMCRKFDFRLKFFSVLCEVANRVLFRIDYLQSLLKSIKKVYPNCEFLVKSKRVNNQNSVIYLHCIYKRCIKATCTISHIISRDGFSQSCLQLSGNFDHSGKPRNKQLRGLSRQKAQQELTSSRSIVYSDEKMLTNGTEPDFSLINTLRKNLSTFTQSISKTGEKMLTNNGKGPNSSSVNNRSKVRKNRLKASSVKGNLKCSEILAFEEFASMSKTIRTFKNYNWWHDWSFDLAQISFQRSCVGIMHFDASANVVEIVNEKDERFLYYAGVVQLGLPSCTEILPLIQSLTVCHTIDNICSILSQFHSNAINLGGLPFNYVITDFSWPLLISCCLQFNNCSIIQYINTCYNDILQNSSTNKIILKICSTQFIKIIINDLILHIKQNTDLKLFILGIFGNLFLNSTNYKFCLNLFEKLVILLGSEFISDEVHEALNYFNHPSVNNSCLELNLYEKKEIISSIDKPPMFKNRFYSDFYEIYVKFIDLKSTLGCETRAPNPFRCSSFLLLCINKYFPYIPLWSCIMHPDQNIITNNAPITSFFNHVKNSVLEERTNLSPIKFKTIMKTYMENNRTRDYF